MSKILSQFTDNKDVPHFIKTFSLTVKYIMIFCVFLRVCSASGLQEACCAYVIVLMAVYWCTEALPLAVTALLPAVLFPMFGIMTSKEVRHQQTRLIILYTVYDYFN